MLTEHHFVFNVSLQNFMRVVSRIPDSSEPLIPMRKNLRWAMKLDVDLTSLQSILRENIALSPRRQTLCHLMNIAFRWNGFICQQLLNVLIFKLYVTRESP